VLLTATLATGGCSTIGRLNPFGGDDEPKEVASEGQRIPIVPADQTLEPAAELKGLDFNLPPAAPVADWPLPGGTPEQSHENVEVRGLSIAWKQRFGEGSDRARHVIAPPVVADGKVFVMDAKGVVSARDANSGKEVWRNDQLRSENKRDREAFGGGLAYSGGKLFVASGYRLVAQLDAATGQVGWRHATEQPIHGAPTVAAGRMMVISLDNTLLTFDAATGEPGWTYQALSEPARILSASSPAVSGDTVVAAFGSGELVALRASN